MSSCKPVKRTFNFSSNSVDCYFDASFEMIKDLVPPEKAIVVTDTNVFSRYEDKFSAFRTIVIAAGESNKNQRMADKVIDQLIDMEADRNSFIIGVGGGVVTDLSGYVASVFMRGIPFAFVPTTILAMVDACVGGKNGVDVGIYKNLVGTINQPRFLLYDFGFLQSLPEEQWRSGFAEIIKHACIRDKEMFQYLEGHTLPDFMQDIQKTGALVEKNVDIKYGIVSSDENETGARKLLNFGHTIGHAIENIEGLLHGYAISKGMAAACKISGKVNGFSNSDSRKVTALLEKYGLPTDQQFDKEAAWNILLRDKKRAGREMNFVVLEQIGNGEVTGIPLETLKMWVNEL